MKTFIRAAGLIALSIIFYYNNLVIGAVFALLMALVFWGIPAAVCWIFNLDQKKYDGIIYIETMTDDSTNLRIKFYDKASIPEKTELLIKCDIPFNIKEEEEVQ
jgi:hypothetical protein